MVNANELRLGNLLLWNPKLAHPETTLTPATVEVVSISGDKIGYVSPGVERRAEPFEDDVLQSEPKLLSLEALEPIALTFRILDECGFEKQSGSDEETWVSDLLKGMVFRPSQDGITLYDADRKKIGETIKFLHRFQNLYFSLTGVEMPLNVSPRI